MKKVIFHILMSTVVFILTGCAKQTQNSPVTINLQAGVADVIEAGMAAADNSPETISGNTDENETLPAAIPTIPSEIITPSKTPADTVDIAESDDGVDIDLTKLSSTMVYAEVFSMLSTPRNYIGKIVRMRGDYSFIQDPVNEVMYHACLIKDATACCAQGLEFVLTDDYKYPEDYPKPGDEITIVGQFNFYNEGDYIYYNIIDAVWEK